MIEWVGSERRQQSRFRASQVESQASLRTPSKPNDEGNDGVSAAPELPRELVRVRFRVHQPLRQSIAIRVAGEDDAKASARHCQDARRIPVERRLGNACALERHRSHRQAFRSLFSEL